MKSVKICAVPASFIRCHVAGYSAFANYGNATNENFSSQVVYNYTAYGKMITEAALNR